MATWLVWRTQRRASQPMECEGKFYQKLQLRVGSWEYQRIFFLIFWFCYYSNVYLPHFHFHTCGGSKFVVDQGLPIFCLPADLGMETLGVLWHQEPQKSLPVMFSLARAWGRSSWSPFSGVTLGFDCWCLFSFGQNLATSSQHTRSMLVCISLWNPWFGGQQLIHVSSVNICG